jgi:hypothetical protein
MSGGSFDYAYRHMVEFAEELRDMLSQQGQRKDGWEVGTWEPQVAAKLAEIAAIVDHAAKLAREAEWLYSGDTGEDTFMARVAKIELERPWVGLTDEDLEFWTEELSQGELGRGVLRAVAEHLREKNA